ncbi:xanthine dehydrogenase family protein molybdopterin-binding subunit [Advenella mimigardefordensis]|uniref:Putative IorB-like molybdopterin-binding oxidoreductase n=1 Tax=Advenella mimigardefordensis (strain DSM 17166 / LMG 22922 / DPN7) TaxID=1247726 RepID=W0PE60_ADVMD|nr:molybdopterin cofactor-binding domain-containing protein [Advenella mimigardefordensis]AHG65174.1 putative IorB-like molybdopterin-binding oxidoreductase [Advenella mimigardefordensis DPN7]
MTYLAPRSEQQSLLASTGTLLVLRAPVVPPAPAAGQPGVVSAYLQDYDDVFVAVSEQGWVRAFCGHVDLGTGIQTALAQIVADEMDVPMSVVQMVLGHTDASPNQGPTIASASIQITAQPLRRAAAQARHMLVALAADMWHLTAADLSVQEGRIASAHGHAVDYWTLLAGKQYRAYLQDEVQTKAAKNLKLVGRSQPRVDIPAKALGRFIYVHDMRVPGMWHGRVVRPPYVGRDTGAFIGHSLVAVDSASVSHICPDIKVVVQGDFVGVVARREEHAIRAARELKITWKPVAPLEDLQDLEAAIRRQPMSERILQDNRGEHPDLPPAGIDIKRTYVWPYQMHASIGPSCAVADYQPGHVRVWSGSQNPHMLRVHLSQLSGLDEAQIEIIRLQAAGCYGRNCADDVCGDALLLSQQTGVPVRVQLSREQEHGWEPKGAAQLMDVQGSIDAQGNLLDYDFSTHYPSNDGPLLALLLTGQEPALPRSLQMGDRTAVPPYGYRRQKIVCNDMATIVRASWLRGVSALPNSFAHDCFIDELAFEAQADPLAFRVKNLAADTRAQALLLAVGERAHWQPGRPGSRGSPDKDGWLHGRGVAYARYIHSKFPGFGAAWSAWIIDISVNARSGEIRLNHIVVGQDTGQMVNPAGVRHQLHGNVIQALSRALYEQVGFDANGTVQAEWGAYKIIDFTAIPPIDVVLMDRQDEPPMGAGESASVPCASAVANALFDACGLRFYQAPFTSQTVREALQRASL